VKTPSTERRAIRILSVEEVEPLADAFDPRYRVLVLLGPTRGCGSEKRRRFVRSRLVPVTRPSRRRLNLYFHLFPSLDVELAERLDEVRAEALAARLRHVAGGGVVPIEVAKR
jgi:hypothetical protein